jgi:hypothetical protein
MTKPVGGRGIKAPYQTRVVRVPEPVVEQIQAIIDAYRVGGEEATDKPVTGYNKPVTGYELIRDEIDEWRKSAKVGKERLEKLLQLIYGGDFSC